jgi:hypothetical protein
MSQFSRNGNFFNVEVGSFDVGVMFGFNGGAVHVCNGGAVHGFNGGAVYGFNGEAVYGFNSGAVHVCNGGAVHGCNGGAVHGCNGGAVHGCNGGAVSLDSQGCKPLVGIPTTNRESRSDGINSSGTTRVTVDHHTNNRTDNATAPPFPIRRDTITRGLHPWLSNAIAPRLRSPMPEMPIENS